MDFFCASVVDKQRVLEYDMYVKFMKSIKWSAQQ